MQTSGSIKYYFEIEINLVFIWKFSVFEILPQVSSELPVEDKI